MAGQKKTVEMNVGQKVSESEVKANPGKAGEGHPTPEAGGEVGGRGHDEYVACWCGAINYIWVSDVSYNWYRCWNTSDGVHYFRY
jgi:hypothetical protein